MKCRICGGSGDRIVTATTDNFGESDAVRVVGGEVGTCTCAPVTVPPLPKEPLAPGDFADYLWSLHAILNKEQLDIGRGLEEERSPLTGMLSSVASFLSCAAEDGLWKTDEHGRMALDSEGEHMDTPWGLMEAMRCAVIDELEREKKTT
jgi:hypothetical protein